MDLNKPNNTLFLALDGLERHDIKPKKLRKPKDSNLRFAIDRIIRIVHLITKLIATIIKMLTVSRLKHKWMIIILP